MKTIEDNTSILKKLVKKNTKNTIGRTDCKEFKENGFINDFFINFDVNIKNHESTKMKIRCKLQDIIEDNTRDAIGDFHSKELNEQEFINDIFKIFELKQK